MVNLTSNIDVQIVLGISFNEEHILHIINIYLSFILLLENLIIAVIKYIFNSKIIKCLV